jgi:hypothetical protein
MMTKERGLVTLHHPSLSIAWTWLVTTNAPSATLLLLVLNMSHDTCALVSFFVLLIPLAPLERCRIGVGRVDSSPTGFFLFVSYTRSLHGRFNLCVLMFCSLTADSVLQIPVIGHTNVSIVEISLLEGVIPVLWSSSLIDLRFPAICYPDTLINVMPLKNPPLPPLPIDGRVPLRLQEQLPLNKLATSVL